MKHKKTIAMLLALCLIIGICPLGAFAIDEGSSRVVVGADLSDEQRATVYKTFGINRGDVTELVVTNAEELSYLSGFIDPLIIGSKAISCVYVTIGKAGSGVTVSSSNINWCTEKMYVSALVTAGIEDANVIVTAPFSVAGTAALTGIYKAYEDLTGKPINEEAKLVGAQELVVTAGLADEIGKYDAVEIVNQLKLILEETKNMTDEQLRAEIARIATEYNIALSAGQTDQLVSLCRSLEGLDSAELQKRVESAQDAIKKLSGIQDTTHKIALGVTNVIKSIGDFFSNLFGKKAA